MIVRPVADHEWEIVAWLWQDFRHDLGTIVDGFPYADGRYQHEWLDEHPRADGVGYLAFGDAWAETEEPVPGKPDVRPDHWIRTT